MLYNELPTAFPIYDRIEKQFKNHKNNNLACYEVLISPCNALLPFQFRLSLDEAQSVSKIEIVKDCSGISIDITEGINFKYYTLESGFYIIYEGDVIMLNDRELNLLDANYYLRIEIGENVFYSEVFKVPEERFKKDEENKYLKIEFKCSSDLNPIVYKDRFQQVVYLDTFIYKSEPEVEEDGEKDGINSIVSTFQKLTIKYNFTHLVPDYLKVVLVSLQLHDVIKITAPNNIRSGVVDDCEVTFQDDQGGVLSEVNVKFIQYIITKNACDEIVPYYNSEDETFNIIEIVNDGTNVYIFANLKKGFIYDIVFDERELYASNLRVVDFDGGYKIPYSDVSVQLVRKTINGNEIERSNLINVM